MFDAVLLCLSGNMALQASGQLAACFWCLWAGFDEDWALLVRVKCLDQPHAQTLEASLGRALDLRSCEVGASETVHALKLSGGTIIYREVF